MKGSEGLCELARQTEEEVTREAGPAQQQLFHLPPEPRSRQAVDDDVEAAVEDVEDVGDGDDEVKGWGVDVTPFVVGGAVVDQTVQRQDTPGYIDRQTQKHLDTLTDQDTPGYIDRPRYTWIH